MSIYRGTGGASSVSGSAAVEEVLQASVDAQAAAAAASTSATNAAASESTVNTSATNAATSETNAATSATSSATSATSSATSATDSSTSETNASTSATNAATSASAASSSATSAASSASAASTSATNAASSASAASTSASAASTSATSAASSESTVATSATNAASSATSASTSETNAASSETNAASSATAAASSASGAASSATTVTNKEALVSPYYSDIDTVATNITAVSTVSSNITSVSAFGNTYKISASAPSSPTEGMLWWDSTNDLMKVYDGNSFALAGSAVNGTSSRDTYTATSNQTTFSSTYDVGYVDVYLNGLKLVSGTDFTASNGTSIVLSAGATTGDNVDIVAYGAFSVANTYTQTASDAKFAQVSNNLSDLASAATARTNLGVAIGSDVQAYDADTSKTDVAETRSASINMADNVVQRPVLQDYAETKVAMSANDVDLSLGNVQTKTISGTTTLTFSNPPASGSAGSFTLLLTNGGSAAVTWPTSVDWPAATAPTLTAAGIDVLVFTTIDGGTTWYGIASGLGMA